MSADRYTLISSASLSRDLPAGGRLTADDLADLLGLEPRELVFAGGGRVWVRLGPAGTGHPADLGGARPADYLRYHAHNCRTLADSVRQVFEIFLKLVPPPASAGDVPGCAASARDAFWAAGLGRAAAESLLLSVNPPYWRSELQYCAAWGAVLSARAPPGGCRPAVLGLEREGQNLRAAVGRRPPGEPEAERAAGAAAALLAGAPAGSGGDGVRRLAAQIAAWAFGCRRTAPVLGAFLTRLAARGVSPALGVWCLGEVAPPFPPAAVEAGLRRALEAGADVEYCFRFRGAWGGAEKSEALAREEAGRRGDGGGGEPVNQAAEA